MRRAILGPALTALRADQLGHLELHQLHRDRLDRLADHIGVLIEQHPLDDLLDRHPVGTGHAAPPFVRALESPTIFSAASAGTTFRPTRTYTTLREVTHLACHRVVACGYDASTPTGRRPSLGRRRRRASSPPRARSARARGAVVCPADQRAAAGGC